MLTNLTCRWRLGTAGAVAAGALLAAPAAVAAPQPVTAPAIRGVAPLPGPVAPAARPASDMKLLRTSPDTGVAGQAITISGAGLPAEKDVQLVWMTSSASWILDARTDSVDYIGRKVDKFGVVLGNTRTTPAGAFSVGLKVPRDWGAIHDIFAVVDGVQVARGAFLIERRMTITPRSGPIGTPITVRFTGLGSPLYDSGGAIYWDNKHLGVYTANTTRGEATFVMRAAGPVGKHQIVSGPAITVNYLNVPQSPQPWQTTFNLTFTTTKDNGPPKPSVDWPESVAPTVDARTTMSSAGIAAGSTATARLSSSTGPVASKVTLTGTGMKPGEPVSILWSTVVGNRVNCTGICWLLTGIPLGTATAAADGTVTAQVTIPDNLGGWHAAQLVQGGEVKAQVPYFVTRSLVGVSPQKVKAGQPFTIHLKGVGWTQLDNTVAVTYDNSYVGYGCGFNSNGDVLLNLVATGEPGTHIIDLWPLLYTQNPPYPTAVYGMVPYLSFARDAPGLALGYRIPAIRVAITVVE